MFSYLTPLLSIHKLPVPS